MKVDDDRFDAMPKPDAIRYTGQLIDQAGSLADSRLNDRALALLARLSIRSDLTGGERALLHYFRANACGNRGCAQARPEGGLSKPDHLQLEVLELRRAIRLDGFAELDAMRRCQILTNLGNRLNSVGQPIQAIDHWDRAIALVPKFAIALANRGLALGRYADSLYDGGQRILMLAEAGQSLVSSTDVNGVFDCTETEVYRDGFAIRAAEVVAMVSDGEAAREMLRQTQPLGRSKDERDYRRWALLNRLFLNPMNDLGPYPMAAEDTIHLPSLTMAARVGSIGPPLEYGMYNQLKQEYVSARWLCYEGLTRDRAHPSDRQNDLVDTLSIPSYSLAVEKTKLAFRMAYSLFDKMAFFINLYFCLGIPEKSVSFRSVWFRSNVKSSTLRHELDTRSNWMLGGLFWLSMDLHDALFQEAAEPDAEGLADLRNHLEHKYCQVHEDLGMGYSRFAHTSADPGVCFRIGRDELEAKTLHILRKARAGLIYLSLAIHREELVRSSERSLGDVLPIPLSLWGERGRL